MFIAVFGLGIVACDQFKPKPQKWEYQVLGFADATSTDQLNKAGKDGWELISIQPQEVNGTTVYSSNLFYLKRPLAQ